jgi:hypothetical protein
VTAASDLSVADDTTPHERWLGAQYAVVLTTSSQIAIYIGRGDWVVAHEAILRCRTASDVLARMLEELRTAPANAGQVRPAVVFEIARRVAATDPMVRAACEIGGQQ